MTDSGVMWMRMVALNGTHFGGPSKKQQMYGEFEGFPSEIFYDIALFGLVIRLVEEIRPFTS